MPMDVYLNAVLGLCFVIGLVFICAYLAKRYGINSTVTGKNMQRLNVIASRTLDIKTKVVLLQKDETEYLVLLSPNSSLVLDKTYRNKFKKEQGKNPNYRHKNHKKQDTEA